MNKIIQFLRLSRLVLLVILLLFAVAAKIARAETAYLYTNHYGATGYFGSAAAACAALPNFPSAEAGPIGGYTENGGQCFFQPPGQERRVVGLWSRISKTCDAKELTHNGVSAGVDMFGQNNVFWLTAPQGINAKDWFSDRFNSCENNCIVLNIRDPFYPVSVTEKDGYSSSAFTKKQTGSVCVVEKQNPNDPLKPPPADTGDGADGNGQGNSGSDNGQGDGSNSGSPGSGSEGSGSQNNPGSGDDDNSGSNGSGSGSGSGGGSSGSIYPRPGGGGTGSGSDSGSEGEGSEGSDGDGESGDGENGSPGGDSGGQSGADSGGQGQVGGTEGGNSDGQNGQSGGESGDPNGQGQGEGNGEGEGSISGGSCEANKAPQCKGDPIQCYIAVEQWRTACAASGQSNVVESEGNCESNTPPKCKGDAVQCYMAKQQWQQGCAAAAVQGAIGELSEYGKGQQGYLDELAREGNPDGILDGVKTDTIDLVGKLNTGLVKLPNACPRFPPIDLGIYGKYDIETDDFCSVLRTLGRILLAMSYIFAFGIIVRAM